MIQDVSVSETITEEYQTYCRNEQERIPIDLTIMILSSNSWPLSHPAAMTLPPEVIQRHTLVVRRLYFHS